MFLDPIDLIINNINKSLSNNKTIKFIFSQEIIFLFSLFASIPFDIPLDNLESIFDFWLDTYKNQEAWETCIGLLKIRKRIPLTKLIERGSLKGNSKKWAIKIENLHAYVPNSLKLEKLMTQCGNNFCFN